MDADGKLVPANREIRIQDLLNMTSGIPYPDQWSVSQKKMGAFYDEINRRNDTAHPVDTQEFARRVGEDVPLMFQPGEKWFYGASADVLGAVLEKAADMPLDALYRKRVFQPLGMTDTDFYVPEEKRSRLAQLYQYVWDGSRGGLVVEPDPHLGMTDYRKSRRFSLPVPGWSPRCRTICNLPQCWLEKGCIVQAACGSSVKTPGAISPRPS